MGNLQEKTSYRRRGLSRRQFIGGSGLTLGAMLVPITFGARGAAAEPLRIGIIGAGQIGSAVGLQWAMAGHQVFFSSRNPDELAPLVEEGGPGTQAGTPAEAAAFGDVIAIGTPYDALPQIGSDYAADLQGKVVIVFSNPARQNGGPATQDAMARGWGVVTAELLPGARITRAFNAINFRSVTTEANREGERIGIPVVGDDQAALMVTTQLVDDAGFDPVVVGGLERASAFDMGTPVFAANMTAAELRDALGL